MSETSQALQAFRALSKQLTASERVAKVPTDTVVRALGAPASQINYMGTGRTISEIENPYAMYVRGATYGLGSFITHSIHAYLFSSPDHTGKRQSIGTFGLFLNQRDQLSVFAINFDQQDIPHPLPAQTLLAPLGGWAVGHALTEMHNRASAFEQGKLGDILYVEPSIDGISGLATFVNAPENRPGYH